MNKLLISTWIIFLTSFLATAEAREVTVSIVTDGPSARQLIPRDVLSDEIDALMGDEFQVTLVEGANGGWTGAGAREALEHELANGEVDVVLAMGLLTAQHAARIDVLAKPVIAPVVADIELQNFPYADGVSGKRNFVYMYDFGGLETEIRHFYAVTSFSELAMLVDEDWVEGLPNLEALTDRIGRGIGAKITIVPVTDSAPEAFGRIPVRADAVYVTPLMRFTEDEIGRLADGLIRQRLPSFSSLGRSEVELGLLGTTFGRSADVIAASRRIAVLLQRTLLGTDPGTLNVAFETESRLAFNLRTARAIGFSPKWSSLVDAQVLFDEVADQGRAVSLTQAMQEALQANLDLAVSSYDVRLADDEVTLARAPLLPQADIGVRYRQIDEDTARLGLAERRADWEIMGSQLIYSDQLYAGSRIASRLRAAAEHDHEAFALDTLRDAAVAYLQVLRAAALEEVERSNVEVTRTNLELSGVRARVGYAGRDEVLRWRSQIALDRQNLLAAEATREQSETELKRVIHAPLDEPIASSTGELDEFLKLLESPAFQQYVNNPLRWATFQDYYSQEALASSPEYASIEKQLRAQQRQVVADRRTFFVPDFSLQARRGENISRSGISAGMDGIDNEWTIGVQATLPIFQGNALRGRLSQSRHRHRQLVTQRDAVAERVEARMRTSLQRVGGSYPAIELSRDARESALENLELVTDKYSQGAVGVTDLVDAQSAALEASLGAAEAEYRFLIDFMDVMRSAGSFDLLTMPGSSAEWLQGLESYFEDRGISHGR